MLNAIAPDPRNAAWELFSTEHDRIRHGAAHYQPRRSGTWDLLRCLYVAHILEDPSMAYTMEEFIRKARQQFLQELTPEEQHAVLDRLPPEERLRGLGPEELRKLQNYLKKLH